MVVYYALDANFETCASIEAKIEKLDVIIDSLLTTALKSVATGNIVEYKIDTGQTVQEVRYSTTKSVTDTLKEYEKLRQYYVNKLIGNSFKTIGNKNLNRRSWGC